MKTYLTLGLLVCGGHFAGMASAKEIDSLCKVVCVRTSGVVRGNESQRQYELNCEFYKACTDNNLALAKKLLKQGADINMKVMYGSGNVNTVLTVVTWETCDLEMVKFLVENGSYINFVNGSGSTALSHAEHKGKKDVVDYLKNCGAKGKEELPEPDSRSNRRDRNNRKQSESPKQSNQNLKESKADDSHFGFGKEKKEISEEERKRQEKLLKQRRRLARLPPTHLNLKNQDMRQVHQFLAAIACGDLKKAEEFLATGISIHATNIAGKSALHIAARGGDMKVLEFLIEKGIAADYQDINGNTALHEALLVGQKEAIAYLIEVGVALNIVNNQGQYVLQLAIQKGYEDIVKLLIKNKVDLNVLTSKEEPMLFLALDKKQLAIAKLLLDAGVDISLTSEKGETIFDFLDRKKKEDPSSGVYSEFLMIMTKDDK